MKGEVSKLQAASRNDKRQSQKLQLELLQAKQLLEKLRCHAQVSSNPTQNIRVVIQSLKTHAMQAQKVQLGSNHCPQNYLNLRWT